jgi:hypothetical protein
MYRVCSDRIFLQAVVAELTGRVVSRPNIRLLHQCGSPRIHSKLRPCQINSKIQQRADILRFDVSRMWVVAVTIDGDCLLADEDDIVCIGQARDALIYSNTEYGWAVVVVLHELRVTARLYDARLTLVTENVLSDSVPIRALVALERFTQEVEVLLLRQDGDLVVLPCFDDGVSRVLAKRVYRYCIGAGSGSSVEYGHTTIRYTTNPSEQLDTNVYKYGHMLIARPVPYVHHILDHFVGWFREKDNNVCYTRRADSQKSSMEWYRWLSEEEAAMRVGLLQLYVVLKYHAIIHDVVGTMLLTYIDIARHTITLRAHDQ